MNINQINTEYTMVDTRKLRPHPDNPRKGDISKIKESIEANGFFGALIVQKGTNVILAGNHRFRAAAGLGYPQVPVIYVDVDDEQAKRILLADNRSNDLAEYDNAKLADLLGELYDETDPDSLLGTGFSTYDIAEIERKVKLAPVPLDLEDDEDDALDLPAPVGREGASAPVSTAPPVPVGSQIYMVNLFMTTATAPDFLAKVKDMQGHYDAENVTDCVLAIIEEKHSELFAKGAI